MRVQIRSISSDRKLILPSLVAFSILIFLIVLWACRPSHTDGQPECIDLRAGLFAPRVVPVSQIADSVQIIKFDLPEEQSFRINCGILVLDRYFVIDTKSACLLFDRQGRFIRTIARSGKEPGDYNGCRSLNLYDNRIYITQYDGTTKVYELNGQYTDSIPSPSPWYDKSYVLDNRRIIGYRNNCTGKKGLQTECYTRDSVLHQTQYTHEYTPKGVAFFPNDALFVRSSEKLLFKELLNDTIFAIDTVTYSLQPVYRLESGEFTPHDSLRFILDNPMLELFLHTPYITLLGESKSACWLTTILGSKEEMKQVYTTYCHDRKTGETYHLDLKISPEEMGKNSIHLMDTTEAFPPAVNWDNFFPTQMTEDGRCLIAVRTNVLVLAYLKEDPAAALSPKSLFLGWKVIAGIGLLLLIPAGYVYIRHRKNKRILYRIRREMAGNERTIQHYRQQLQQYGQQSALISSIQEKTDELNQQIYLLELQNQELQQQLKQLTEKDQKKKQPEALSVGDEGYTLFLKLKSKPTYVFIGDKEHEYLCRVTDELYQQFATRLQNRHPELTRHDIETCCLLKAGLTNQELSIIFNNTPAAITKSKNRIKKRMAIGSNQTLDAFLHEFH